MIHSYTYKPHGQYWEVLKDEQFCGMFMYEGEAKACCILFHNAQLYCKPKMQAQILEFKR